MQNLELLIPLLGIVIGCPTAVLLCALFFPSTGEALVNCASVAHALPATAQREGKQALDVGG